MPQDSSTVRDFEHMVICHYSDYTVVLVRHSRPPQWHSRPFHWGKGRLRLAILRLCCSGYIRRIVYIKHLLCKIKVFVFMCNCQTAHLPLFMELYIGLSCMYSGVGVG